MRSRLSISLASAVFASAACGESVSTRELIEVTGSHVKRVEGEGPAPVVIIRREDIARSAGQNLQDVLLSLPVASVGSFSESNASGIAGISVRGLGTNATLILLNGRRLPVHGFASTVGPPGISFVNLNSIPVSAIERVEVLKDGASAIYGSDAIGGVINIILRKDFRGSELAASMGQSSRGDATETRTALTVGAGDTARDRFNAMAVLDYYHRDALEGWQRERTSTADQRGNGGLDLRQPWGRPGTWLTADTTIPLSQRLSTNTPFPDCPQENRENGLTPLGVCAFNPNTYVGFLPRTNRKSAFGRAVGVISEALSAFFEASWNDNRTALIQSPMFDQFTLPVGHNSNPYPFRVPILYRWADLEYRQNVPHTVTKRALAGLGGQSWGFDWEAAYNRAVSDNTVTSDNFVSLAARNALVNANVYDFVHPSNNDQALADAIRVRTWRSRYSRVESWDAKATGPVYNFASGQLSVAFGAERRKESLRSGSDALRAAGGVANLLPDSHEAGTRTMDAVFGELSANLPASLEVQLAARHESYNDYGGSTAPKIAFAWRPWSGLLVRGGRSNGFRAPSLVQMYTDNLGAILQVRDTARCNGYRQAFGDGDSRTAGACGTQFIRSVNGGNTSLQAETSTSDTLGVVWEPVRWASVALDFFNIRHRRRITTSTLDLLLSNEDVFPGAVVRDPAGPNDLIAGTRGPIAGSQNDPAQRIGIYLFYYNAATASTRGVDLDLRLQFDWGVAGRFRFESLNTYVDRLDNVAVEGQPVTNLLALDRAPRYRGTHNATWTLGEWAASAVLNVVGSTMQPTLINSVRNNVSSWSTVDLQGTYKPFKYFVLAAGIRNALDREPPFYNNDPAGYDTSTQTLVGRFYYLRATLSYK